MHCSLKVFCLCLTATIVFTTRVTGLTKLNDIIASQQGNSRYEEMFFTCKTEIKSSPASYYNQQFDATILKTREDQCILGCLMRKSNMIVNRMLFKEELIRQVQTYYQKNPVKMQMAKYVTEICAKKVQSITDECTLAGALTICVKNETT